MGTGFPVMHRVAVLVASCNQCRHVVTAPKTYNILQRDQRGVPPFHVVKDTWWRHVRVCASIYSRLGNVLLLKTLQRGARSARVVGSTM